MSPNSSSQFVTYEALQESKKQYDTTNAIHSPSYTKLIERQRFLDTKMKDCDPVEKKGCKLWFQNAMFQRKAIMNLSYPLLCKQTLFPVN